MGPKASGFPCFILEPALPYEMWKLRAICLMLVISAFVHGDPKVPCYFIFGDSLSDAGNNNGLKTQTKANYAPYGVDFPGGATGRFSNGRTYADFITKLLGFEGFIPPFSTASGRAILKGVNYASGAAGIRQESGSHLGDRITMDQQILNHAITIRNLASIIKGPVTDYLNKCLYTVNMGSNDYINNYFKPENYPTKSQFNPDQFANALISQYKLQLKALHYTGAIKVAVFGLGLIGCAPGEIARYNATQCVDEINQAVLLFNQKLGPLIDDLNANLPGAKFTFIDIFAMGGANPLSNITTTPCCKVRSDFQCEPSIPPCTLRLLYQFMDGYHPTEVAHLISAGSAFISPDAKFVHPVDINRLVSKEY